MPLTAEEALNYIKSHKRVAIIGLSPKEDRPSNMVGKFLADKGFEITPVVPFHKEIFGKKVFASLAELNKDDVDWIDMFVNPKRLPEFLDDIKRLQPELVWCQIGVVNEDFNRELEEAGIPYIADLCPKMEWRD